MPRRRRSEPGGDNRAISPQTGRVPAFIVSTGNFAFVETRLLILNADPVFQDRALSVVGMFNEVESRVVRSLPEAISVLLEEHFDGLMVEGEAALAVDQATNVRQHFPSLGITCLVPPRYDSEIDSSAEKQKITLISDPRSRQSLRRELEKFISSLGRHSSPAAEGIDPCHSLIGNLNQFSAAEILQMSCLSQRSGRFTFKSGRGNSEIFLQHGSVRHAVFGSLEGEAAVAEIFRWRQGRFYFEEGIISQVQTVDRPWAHLLIDNLQKLDETLELVSVPQS
jgi:hypothetical protein